MAAKRNNISSMKLSHKGHKLRPTVTNAVPAVVYCAEVNAFSLSQVLRLRSQVSKSCGQSLRGLNMELGWSFSRIRGPICGGSSYSR
eukprot:8789709-Pyramimonas_sp.AAC.1